MRRREFITLIGGSVAWPLAASAQQRAQMRRIGVLMSAASETDQQAALAVFKDPASVGLDRRSQCASRSPMGWR